MKFVWFYILFSGMAMSCFADEGVTYPGHYDITFSHEYLGDTTVIEITNFSGTVLKNIILSDYSLENAELVDCIVDGRLYENLRIEFPNGDIYPDRITSRYIIDSAYYSVKLKYITATGIPYYFSWFANSPEPLFGLIETCCRERGDINHSGGIEPVDIQDIIALIDYLFSPEKDIVCYEEMNVDGLSYFSDLSIQDLTYLITYLFHDGDKPPLCR